MKWTPAQNETALGFTKRLKDLGYDFFTGVPCSLLGALIDVLQNDKSIQYIPAAREDSAIGMASGAALAGRKAAVLMQNSGIGYSLNVLTSLNLIYQIPVLCIVTYRGFGPDAPEHIIMGKSCEALLKEVGMETFVPEPDSLIKNLENADRKVFADKKPAALFIKKGIFGA